SGSASVSCVVTPVAKNAAPIVGTDLAPTPPLAIPPPAYSPRFPTRGVRFPEKFAAKPRLSTDGPLELGLVHLRASADVLRLCLVVELITGTPARTRVRTQPSSSARRDVVGRSPTRLPGLASAG